MIESLKLLVYSFDDEMGLPGKAYDAAKGLIRNVMGNDAVSVFTHYIEYTEERFYLKKGFAQGCWNDMIDAVR